jgi:FlaG/FlaF family flagellin (archaellin)
MKRLTDDAVSPVVGVILMLVVTIIIAAVVSGFAGGLMSSQEKAPQLTMQVSIKNTGTWVGSHFEARVLGVDEPIPTKDLKLVTSYKYFDGAVEKRGGEECIPGKFNVHYMYKEKPPGTYYYLDGTAPFGYGIGADRQNAFSPDDLNQTFGNYTLKAGVSMIARAAGAGPGATVGSSHEGEFSGPGGIDTFTPFDGGYGVEELFKYKFDDTYYSSDDVDEIQAVLGKGWENLRCGDVVNVKFIHTPSGKIIWEKDVIVEGDL